MNQYFVLQDFFSLYLIVAGFPDMGYPYPGFRIWTSRIRLVLTRLARVRRIGRLVDDILYIHDLALAVPQPVADYIRLAPAPSG